MKWLTEGIAGAWGTFIEKAQEGPVGSVWLNQLYILNKVSLNRNAEDRHLLVADKKKKVAWKAGISPHVLYRSSGSGSLLQCWWRLREWNTYWLPTYQRAWEKPDRYPKPTKWAVCHVLGPINTTAQHLCLSLIMSQYYTTQVGAHSRK